MTASSNPATNPDILITLQNREEKKLTLKPLSHVTTQQMLIKGQKPHSTIVLFLQ